MSRKIDAFEQNIRITTLITIINQKVYLKNDGLIYKLKYARKHQILELKHFDCHRSEKRECNK